MKRRAGVEVTTIWTGDVMMMRATRNPARKRDRDMECWSKLEEQGSLEIIMRPNPTEIWISMFRSYLNILCIRIRT